MNEKIPKGLIILGIAGLVGLILIFSSFKTIESGTVGIKSTFGNYSMNALEPGLHFKMPFFQEIKLFDTKLQSVTYKGAKDGGIIDGEYVRKEIRVIDEDELVIRIEANVQFVPVASDAPKILSTIGQNYFEKELNSIFRKTIRDVVGKYNASDISSKREELGSAITIALEKQLKDSNFRLKLFNLRDIILPEVISKKAIAIQEANQEEARLALVEKQALQKQKNVDIEIQTAYNKSIKEAKAIADKRKIDADAKAYAIAKEAEAISKANKDIAKSITNILIKYNTIDKWDGKLPTTSLQGGNGVNPNIILGIK